jgi:ParB family chromosome partitioning protein
MANAKQKISLNVSRDIPFNKLVLSQSNVRRIKNGQTIENLAADIGRRGLLQSLNVRPVLDGEGSETGTFQVPAGGRRYRALELLVKQKRMTKTQPVPCVVTDANSVVPIEEDSLAENFHREDLHPLDMFRAFQTLYEQGATHEEIASRFFVSATFVQQRLRLAKVSPTLLEVYEQDGMTLDQLMAFTVTDDHARQEQVWQSLENSWSKEPHQIRRMLTETTVRATDRRALFVGIDPYVTAGGVVLRDLFEVDNGGWLQDPVLLDRLVGGKLRAAADEVAAEGWKWIVVDVDLPYGHTHGLRVLTGSFVDPTDEEQASRDALQKEYDHLESEHRETDDLPEEVDRRLGDIERELEALENRPMIYDPVEIARAGVFVSIDRDGDLVVDRGYVRPEDDVTEPVESDSAATGSEDADATGSDAAVRGTTITMGGQSSEPDEDDDDGIKPLPDRLITELTAHRTVALRDAVAGNPHVALTLLLHGLVSERFRRHGASCLQVSLLETHFPMQSADLRETSSAKAITERHESWAADIPSEDSALWDWLAELDDASRLALLAHCVSFGVNALHEKANPYGTPSVHTVRQRVDQANRLARAVGLDMVEVGWRPTVANYLGRVTKARILAAVGEAKGTAQAQLIDHLKKTEMAEKAADLLADTGWVPEPLRTSEAAAVQGAAVGVAETDSTGGETVVGDSETMGDDDRAMADVPAVAA